MINIRRVGEVADNSVTIEKLADGAVDLSTAKVTGELPTEKLEDGAVNEAKLGALAVSTEKLKANAVTLAKSADDIKVASSAGDEEPISVTGLVEVGIKTMSFPKKTDYEVAKVRFIGTLKTNDILKTASLKIYFDGEVSARATYTSVSLTNEVIGGEIDVSDLALNEIHEVVVKLVSDVADGIATNELTDFRFIL